MIAQQRLLIGDARVLPLEDGSVQAVVTSPPYPMVQMWDGLFASMNPEIAAALEAGSGPQAFELMHLEMDKVWAECFRVLQPGGLLLLNIGDATRSLNKQFALYPNHARMLSAAMALGFTVLPDILWRKPNNSPTKFMGSGMLPAGAYVTYEHEYVLVLRKGGRREFKRPQDKENRRRSAIFWEERNQWFSDLWELRGTRQRLGDPGERSRSAAFPVELALRLILMHSVYGDTILDPFCGTGTTLAAAAMCARSGVGVELDPSLLPAVQSSLDCAVALGQSRQRGRLSAHQAFVEERVCKHENAAYGPVVTRQERTMELLEPVELSGQGPWTVRSQPVPFTAQELSVTEPPSTPAPVAERPAEPAPPLELFPKNPAT